MPGIELVCVDMAGTTVSDDGVVERAFGVAAGAVGVAAGSAAFARAMVVVRETMGQAKIEVFRCILGDEDTAQRANLAFEQAYADLLASGAVAPLPGAAETLNAMRDDGIRLCLTTGFAPATRDAVLARLGWASMVDLAVSPVDAGRGRPWPDMIQFAARTLGVSDPAAVAVAGDTPSDVRAGRAAGASVVAGVLTGSGSRAELAAAGATHVLEQIGELPAVLRALPERARAQDSSARHS